MKLILASMLALSLLACVPKTQPIPEANRFNAIAEPGSPRCFFVYDGRVKWQCEEN